MDAQTEPRIDLNSSAASKFLVQLTPWELHPSPVTPSTRAAVPFKWEETPGRPKPPPRAPDRQSPRPALHLPPRLLLRPPPSAKRPPPQGPAEEPGARHRRSCSSGSAEEKRVISIERASEKLEDDDDDDKGAERGILSQITPAYDLGPADLHWGDKASALIAIIWRKYSSSSNHNKVKSHPNSNSHPSGDLRIYKEGRRLWVNDYAQTDIRGESLNAIIAAAVGTKIEALDFSPYSKNTHGFYSEKTPKRKGKKRKWVLRKLRRPAQLFKSFFSAVWRAVCIRKSRHRSIRNMKHSYQSLSL